jgi:hypothetical protein
MTNRTTTSAHADRAENARRAIRMMGSPRDFFSAKSPELGPLSEPFANINLIHRDKRLFQAATRYLRAMGCTQ